MTTMLVATVTVAPVGGFASVAWPDGRTDIVAAARLTIGVGDQVLVTSDRGQMWITAVLGTSAAPPAPPPIDDGTVPEVPPEQRPVVTGSEKGLQPSWSGSHRGGAWRAGVDELYQGTWTSQPANRGAAMFGSLDAFGTLVGATAVLRRRDGGVFGAQTPTMLLLAPQAAKTGGFPTVLASTAGPAIAVNASAQWTLPAGWRSQMQAGTAAGIGIGTGAATPYIALDPITLDIDWTRSL